VIGCAAARALSGKKIEIVECSWDRTRIYFEQGVRQSQATADGESVFTYLKLMDELLQRSANILVLGCGGGNLATRLARLRASRSCRSCPSPDATWP